ncbi:MAG TPA: carbamoyl-phosphate synthase large subunit [Candidatus Goldiibacteriota bacterium]|nr:carbamoyl-phosphate synthase large subunit [Candidatus Goldiibacteriota bacterium]
MPKRRDLKTVLLIGSGPIVIGQGCEFDYSGTQACKALKEEGYRVVLVNSNPATIMTDPEFADATYIEPLTVDILEKIVIKEKLDAILPTVGGQTALNLAMEFVKKGLDKKYKVELIGANAKSIKKAEDREEFKQAMKKIGMDVPKSSYVTTMAAAMKAAKEIKFPIIIRPAFTLGGTGGGIAYNAAEFKVKADKGMKDSPVHGVLLEESVLGWKEYELEVMRDLKDNVVIICSIENLDPMGVHTGDSITVAPAQTLTDREYQFMRDAAVKIIREIGVDTGGSNIQFAVNPENGRMIVIEMNPRVSRSSALASKATGFPIAKIAAKLAVGYTLDEIPNDITRYTPASFEPALDYVVTKIPRFTFEKFKESKDELGVQMKSVGEAMAIGRTFKESFQKALRSMEIGRHGFGSDGKDIDVSKISMEELREKIVVPSSFRIFYLKYAMQKGMTDKEINEITKIDPWFLHYMREIYDEEKALTALSVKTGRLTPEKAEVIKAELIQAKKDGFSDVQLAYIFGVTEDEFRGMRRELGIKPVYKMVDTCASEFKAYTPYLYSTYDSENENPVSQKKKGIILGGGPNRIGQGIEFDYCCVHGVFALKELGYEVSMVNCNPETVSTDYDTSDKLYFEPLTMEDVMAIADEEGDKAGFIAQFGGQTPLKLAMPLYNQKVKIMGTSPLSIDVAEDREKFDKILTKLNISRPENGTAFSLEEAWKIVKRIGYPVLVRPSYVLGGRGMEIVYDDVSFEKYAKEAFIVSEKHPVLIDKFLEDAIEVDVDCVCDGKEAVICGIMEHIEEAGIHSGDSACVLPPLSIRQDAIAVIRDYTHKMALELNVKGLMNVQYALRNDHVYVLEVNPRASRTVPFVSKATGISWAKIATKIMAGMTIKQLKVKENLDLLHIAVKEAVLPFNKFQGADIVLGPEMKSTGEVMGIDSDFGHAYYKAQIAAGQKLPSGGAVFVSVKNKNKRDIVFVVKKLRDMGFDIIATEGTANVLRKYGITAKTVKKVSEASPNILDTMKAGKVQLIINTPVGKGPRSDDYMIRTQAIALGIPYTTTMAGAQAVVTAIEAAGETGMSVKSIQEYYKEARKK